MSVRCRRCFGEGWICEEHEDQPGNHGGCKAAGEPCPLCNAGNPPRLPDGWVSFARVDDVTSAVSHDATIGIVACATCRGSGQRCAAHPWSVFPHDACSGPGTACADCHGTGREPNAAMIDGNRTRTAWTRYQADRVLRCELRDDTRVGAGVEVRIFEANALIDSQRCATEAAANSLADVFRERFERNGWTADSSHDAPSRTD
jgi:hypothetical protein